MFYVFDVGNVVVEKDRYGFIFMELLGYINKYILVWRFREGFFGEVMFEVRF